MTVKNYYKILGVNEKAISEEIKKAYRQLAKQNHPDVNPGDKAAEERFKEINEAYDTLGDIKKRHQYDLLRRGGLNDFGFSKPGVATRRNDTLTHDEELILSANRFIGSNVKLSVMDLPEGVYETFLKHWKSLHQLSGTEQKIRKAQIHNWLVTEHHRFKVLEEFRALNEYTLCQRADPLGLVKQEFEVLEKTQFTPEGKKYQEINNLLLQLLNVFRRYNGIILKSVDLSYSNMPDIQFTKDELRIIKKLPLLLQDNKEHERSFVRRWFHR